MNIEIGQVITQIIAFLIMLWVLKRYGWKPLLNILEERKQKIQGEFNSIALQQNEVKQLQENYQEKMRNIDSEARHKIQEAVGQGRKIATKIEQEAHKDAQEILERAKSDVGNEIAKAKHQLQIDMVNLATAATEKILKEKLDADEQKKLMIEFVKGQK